MRTVSPIVRNDEAIANGLATFQRSYDPSLSLGLIMGLHQGAHRLRGFWPFSSIDENGNAYDLGGQARGLTAMNSVSTSILSGSIIPYASFVSGSGHYYRRVDEPGLSITGALTMACWVYFTTVPASFMGVMGKWALAGGRSYRTGKTSGNLFQFAVSSDGTAETSVTTAGSVTTDTMYFTAGRFTPSSELKVWLASDPANDIETVINTTSIPASIFDSTSDFEIGRSAGGNYLNGRIALGLLAAAGLSDDYIENLYHRSRPLFGL